MRSKSVRIRNITYALTGSIDAKGSAPIKYRLEPNVWTDVPDEVFEQLKNKFGNSKFSEAPNSLPEVGGIYNGQPGQTRAELTNGQYLIEFRS